MLKWSFQEHDLALKYTWKINNGQDSRKKIYILTATDGAFVGYGEIAGVTKEVRQGDIRVSKLVQESQKTLQTHPEEIISNYSYPSSFRMAVDEALHDLKAQQQSTPVSQLLGLEHLTKVQTCYALPILPLQDLATFYKTHHLNHYKSLKIKINQETPAEYIQEIHRLHPQGELWLDANQAFTDLNSARALLTAVHHLPIRFVEQVFSHQDFESHRQLKKHISLPLFADESLQDQDLTQNFSESFDGINIKLLKAGSYQQAIKQAQQARDQNMSVLLGCMVETSIGISSAMHIAALADFHDLDGFLYFDKEPFEKLCHQQDKIYPILRRKN